MAWPRGALIWVVVASIGIAPTVLAAFSPLLAYRNVEYVIGGFAGIVCLALLLLQPLLAGGYLPGLRADRKRRWHSRTGWAAIFCAALHIGGLYLTSSADTLDALLLVAPTPFAVYGVIAMWGVVLTALLVALRGRLHMRVGTWSLAHNALALAVVVATVIHAVQIEGAMEPVSKWVLCISVLAATCATLSHLRVFRARTVQVGHQPEKDLSQLNKPE